MLEVMFSTLVLIVSLLAAFMSQIVSLNLVRTARDANTAASELTAAIEEVTSFNLDALPQRYPNGVEIAKYDGRALRDESIVVTYPNLGGGGVPNPLQVVLTINWIAWNGQPSTMTLATMKAR